jgi:hypothetical protein
MQEAPMPDPQLRTPCLFALLVVATSIVLPRDSLAQRRASSPPARRGAPGAAVPMTDVSIALGKQTVSARVDADCHIDAKATPGSPRAYFIARYPWFGQRVTPDKPQWRFDLEIRRGKASEASDQFVFSYSDGPRSGTIQTVSGSERMGSGTVTVTRHGAGARFDVEGRTKEGEPVRATIDCSMFQKTESAGG